MAKTKPQQMSQAAAFMEGRKRNGSLPLFAAATFGAFRLFSRAASGARLINFLKNPYIPIPMRGPYYLSDALDKIAGTDKTKRNKLRNGAAQLSDRLQKLDLYMNETTVDDVTANIREKLSGANEFVPTVVGKETAQKVKATREEVVKTTNSSINRAAGKLDTLLGVSDWATKKATQKAKKFERLAKPEIENKLGGLQRFKTMIGLKSDVTMADDAEVNAALKKSAGAFARRKDAYMEYANQSASEQRATMAKARKAQKSYEEYFVKVTKGKESGKAEAYFKEHLNELRVKAKSGDEEARKIRSELAKQKYALRQASKGQLLDEAEAKGKKALEKLEKEYGKVSSKAKNHVSQQRYTIEDEAKYNARKDFLKDPVNHVTKRIQNASLNEVVDKTMRYGSLAATAIGRYKALGSEKRAMRFVVADCEEKDPREVSNWEVTVNTVKTNLNAIGSVFGMNFFKISDSPLVVEAYKQYARSYSFSIGSFVLVAGGQEYASNKLNRNAKDPTTSFLISMGINTAMNASGALRARVSDIQPSNQQQGMGMSPMGAMPQARRANIMDLYQQYRLLHEQGQAMDGNMYLDLMTTASKDVRDIGGISSYKMVVLANYFMYEQTPVAEVMKHLNQGKAHIEQLAEHAANEVTKLKQQQQAQAEEEQAQAQAMSDQQPQPGGAVGEGKFTGEARNQSRAGFDSFAQQVGSQAAEPAAGVGVGAS